MKKIILSVVLLLGVTLILHGCHYSTANLSKVKLCQEMVDTECPFDKAEFNTDIKSVYCTAKLNNAPDGTIVTFTWRDISGDEAIVLDSIDLDNEGESSVNVYSYLTAPSDGWPAGEYDVVLSLNSDNSEPIYKEFTVK